MKPELILNTKTKDKDIRKFGEELKKAAIGKAVRAAEKKYGLPVTIINDKGVENGN